MVESEIAVRREGTEGKYALVSSLLDGWDDDILLLAAKQSSVAAVRVEAQHGDARLVDDEILLERSVEQTQLAENLFFADG